MSASPPKVSNMSTLLTKLREAQKNLSNKEKISAVSDGGHKEGEEGQIRFDDGCDDDGFDSDDSWLEALNSTIELEEKIANLSLEEEKIEDVQVKKAEFKKEKQEISTQMLKKEEIRQQKEQLEAAEEEIEEFKSLLEESKLANEEIGKEVTKAIAEEKELKGSLESRAKQLEEMKREVQEQETESQAARRELVVKLTENLFGVVEAATLRKKQELARLSGLADLDKVQLRDEQEKERKVKENLDRLQLREEKEKEEPNHSISEPSKDDIKPLEVAEEEYDEEVVNKMRQEVRQAREMVRRATRHKEMLRELYEERNKNNKHADKSFAELRGEYIR